jgi:glycosyltransferase involved in cell wall biosynthesis
MTESVPLISVVIPVFNGADYLGEAITSALAQTWPNIDIVVVDDGSNDNGKTQAVIASFGDRIRAFHQPNGGVAAALNRGIAEATGDYISWLSHDDLYDPRKVETQIKLLLASGGACVVFGDYDIINSHGGFVFRYEVGSGYEEATSEWAVLEGRINGCTLLLPRECFEACGYFDPALPTTQDYDLWFRIAQRYRFVHQAGALVRHRRHPGQGSLSLRHRDEASLLWCDWLDRLDPEGMVRLGGSPIRFLLRLRRFFQRTGYEGAKARINAMLAVETARIPITLLLVVTPAVDIHNVVTRLRHGGIGDLSILLVDAGDAARDSLVLRDPTVTSLGPVYRLAHGRPAADIMTLASSNHRGRYVLCVGPATKLDLDALRTAIEKMEEDETLGWAVTVPPNSKPDGALGPFDGSLVRRTAIGKTLELCRQRKDRFPQTLALSTRMEVIAPVPVGTTIAVPMSQPRVVPQLGRSLPARWMRRVAFHPLVAARFLKTARFASRHLHHDSARLQLRRAVEILFRVGGLVDIPWYRARYGDVTAAKADPVIHYLLDGWRERRDPSPGFSTRTYFGAYPELARGHLNPLTQMTVFGKAPPSGKREAPPPPDPKEPFLLTNSDQALKQAVQMLSPGHRPDRPSLLLMLHMLRGGTARYCASLGALASRSVNVTYARGLDDRYLMLSRSVDGADEVKIDLSTDFSLAVQVLRQLRIGRIDVLHTIGLESWIARLVEALRIPFDLTFLDYHLLSTNPHLCDRSGRFVGDGRLKNGDAPLLRAERSPLLERASRLLACSRDLADRIHRIAPSLHPIPVRLPEPDAPAKFRVTIRPLDADGSLRVLLMGAISRHKGFALLGQMIEQIRTRDLPISLHFLGRVPPEALDPSLIDPRLHLHGPYQDAELTTLVCRIRPHLAWFPFQAPETHSFTLSDAMLNGLPILASDIGAVAERLDGRPHSWMLPWDSTVTDWISFLERLRREELETPAIWRQTDHLPPLAERFYETEYLQPLFDEKLTRRPRKGSSDGRVDELGAVAP